MNRRNILDAQRISIAIAERIRDEGTKQGVIPFDTGDLRKSISTYPYRAKSAAVGSNLPYAAAVHDGRGPVTITPNLDWNPPHGKRKHQDPERARLMFNINGLTVFAREVHQPARAGQPFLFDGWRAVQRKGFGFLHSVLDKPVEKAFFDKLVDDIRIEL